MQWSSLEYVLVQAIWAMINVDAEVGKILTAHLDIKQRAAMAFAVSNQTNAPVSFRNALKAVQRSLQDDDLINRRNQAVHGIHFSTDRPDAVNVEMHRGKGGRAPRLQTDADLAKLSREICEVRTRFGVALLAYAKQRMGDQAATLESFAAMEAILQNMADTKSEAPESGPV